MESEAHIIFPIDLNENTTTIDNGYSMHYDGIFGKEEEMSDYTRPPLATKEEAAKCPTCHEEFFKKRPWQDFCSQKCQMRYWSQTHPRVKSATIPTDRLKKGN
jgi:hypothetical protein